MAVVEVPVAVPVAVGAVANLFGFCLKITAGCAARLFFASIPRTLKISVATARLSLHCLGMSRCAFFRRSIFLFIACLSATPWLHAQREKFPPEILEVVEKSWPEAKKTNTGLRYIIERPGSGARPNAGDNVAVLYTGRLLSGEVFDEANDKEKPFTFRVAREQVIKGWDQILPLMQVGEKRIVIIPPELAYGTRGQAPKIPRNAALVFTIELLDIKP